MIHPGNLRPRLSYSTIIPRIQFAVIFRFQPCQRFLHFTLKLPATALPIIAHGPPPKPPLPATLEISEMRIRRRSLLAKAARNNDSGQYDGSKLRAKRFWKETLVKETHLGYNVMLDSRALKTPMRNIISIPKNKEHLAHGVSLEWENLKSVSQATSRSYLTPLTQLVSRVVDLQHIYNAFPDEFEKKKKEIVDMCMRFLDTDTLLTWSPPPNVHMAGEDVSRGSLRDLQIEETEKVVGWVEKHIWPGIVIHPLDTAKGFLATVPQREETKKRIREWIEGLSLWDLVGLERCVLSSKSLIIGIRLIAEWSENKLTIDGRIKLQQAEKAADTRSKLSTILASKESAVENSESSIPLTSPTSPSASETYPTPSSSSSSFKTTETFGLESPGGAPADNPFPSDIHNTNPQPSSPSPIQPSPDSASPTSRDRNEIKRFGIEEAVHAASLEVQWQTRQWGEVEDTHDVEKEDLRRQLGAGVLLVCGDRGRVLR